MPLMTAVLVLTLAQAADQTPLEGCLQVAALAGEIRQLKNAWTRLTPEQLAAQWDIQLVPEPCEVDGKSCRMLVSRRRVIAAVSQCSETFVFTGPPKGEPVTATDAVVNHTTQSYAEVSATARLIFAALAPPRGSGPAPETWADSATKPIDVRYQWQDGRILWGAGLRAEQIGAVWRLQVSFGPQ